MIWTKIWKITLNEDYLLNKIENILEKGENALFEQFLQSSQCFQKSSAAEISEGVFMWGTVKLTILLKKYSIYFFHIFIGLLRTNTSYFA